MSGRSKNLRRRRSQWNEGDDDNGYTGSASAAPSSAAASAPLPTPPPLKSGRTEIDLTISSDADTDKDDHDDGSRVDKKQKVSFRDKAMLEWEINALCDLAGRVPSQLAAAVSAMATAADKAESADLRALHAGVADELDSNLGVATEVDRLQQANAEALRRLQDARAELRGALQAVTSAAVSAALVAATTAAHVETLTSPPKPRDYHSNWHGSRSYTYQCEVAGQMVTKTVVRSFDPSIAGKPGSATHRVFSHFFGEKERRTWLLSMFGYYYPNHAMLKSGVKPMRVAFPGRRAHPMSEEYQEGELIDKTFAILTSHLDPCPHHSDPEASPRYYPDIVPPCVCPNNGATLEDLNHFLIATTNRKHGFGYAADPDLLKQILFWKMEQAGRAGLFDFYSEKKAWNGVYGSSEKFHLHRDVAHELLRFMANVCTVCVHPDDPVFLVPLSYDRDDDGLQPPHLYLCASIKNDTTANLAVIRQKPDGPIPVHKTNYELVWWDTYCTEAGFSVDHLIPRFCASFIASDSPSLSRPWMPICWESFFSSCFIRSARSMLDVPSSSESAEYHKSRRNAYHKYRNLLQTTVPPTAAVSAPAASSSSSSAAAAAAAAASVTTAVAARP